MVPDPLPHDIEEILKAIVSERIHFYALLKFHNLNKGLKHYKFFPTYLRLYPDITGKFLLP